MQELKLINQLQRQLCGLPSHSGPVPASRPGVIPWVLPEKPTTVQISDSHGPESTSQHMLTCDRGYHNTISIIAC